MFWYSEEEEQDRDQACTHSQTLKLSQQLCTCPVSYALSCLFLLSNLSSSSCALTIEPCICSLQDFSLQIFSPKSVSSSLHALALEPCICCLQDFSLQMPFSCDYRPRFCMETGDLDLRLTAANDAAIQCDLTLYRLECAEHLPVSGREAAPAAATLAEVRSNLSELSLFVRASQGVMGRGVLSLRLSCI